MDFLDLAKQRYTVRSYLPNKVEEQKRDLILEAGRIAPTAANLQPQHLIVVESEEGMKKLAKAANVYKAPLAIIVCADRNVAWTRPLDKKIHSDIDASIITDHMQLEATELGLGTTWICYFKPEVLQQEFSLPEGVEPINILAIGYADTAKEPPLSPDRHGRTRKPLGETVSFE